MPPVSATGRRRHARPLQPPSSQPSAYGTAGRGTGDRPAQGTRIGPARPAARVGIASSTAHRILTRNGLPPLSACDRATGEPVRRYEHPHPGDLVCIDVQKLGRIPMAAGIRRSGGPSAVPTGTGTAALPVFAHRPRRPLPPGLHRSPAGRDRRHLRRLPAPCHDLVRRPRDHHHACPDRQRLGLFENHLVVGLCPAGHPPVPDPVAAAPDQRQGRAIPPHPAGGVGYHRPYLSESERQAAFGDWLDWYNYHRPHTGIGGQTPASRVTNLSEQHT